MPPRVNKKLLLIIVGSLLVLVILGTIWVVFGRGGRVRRLQVIEDAKAYHVAGQKQKERFILESWLAKNPADVEIRTKLAQVLDDQGDASRAYAHYRQIVRRDPRNVEALRRLAYYEGRMRNWGEMRRVAREIIGFVPADGQAHLYMAQACLGLGPDYLMEALQHARVAVEKSPRNIEACLALARVHERRRDVDEVKKVLDEALRVDPKSQDLWSFLGNYHLRLGERDKAEAAFKAAVENAGDPVRAHIELASLYVMSRKWADAETHFKTACDNAVTQLEKLNSHSALGNFYVRRNQLDKALEQYDEALIAFPKAPSVLLKKARVYLTQEKTDDARRLIDDVKARGRRDAYLVEALFLNGLRLMRENRHDEAMEELQRALTTQQLADFRLNTAEIHLALARGHLRRQDINAARQSLLSAYARAPKSVNVMMSLARVLFTLRDYDQVVAVLSSPRKPTDGHILLARAYMMRGREDDNKKALRVLEGVRKQSPKDPRAHMELGRLAVRAGKTPEAVKHFDEAIKLSPKSMRAYLAKAATYELDKKTREAEATIRRALTVMPRNVRLRYELARFLGRNKRFEEGEKLLLDEIDRLPEDSADKRLLEANLPQYYLAMGKTDKALECYRRRAAKDPKDVRPRQAIVLFSMLRNPDEARKYIAEIGAIEGERSPRVLKLTGQILVSERKFKEGLKELLVAEKDLPGDLDLAYYIGLCYLRTGEPTKSRAYMERVAQRYPGNAGVQRALAEAYYTLGDFEEAKKLAERLRAGGQGGVALDIIIADTETKTGRAAEGEAGWRSFVRKNPDRPEGWIGLADALWRQGKQSEAVEAMRKGYELDRKSFRTTWTLATMHVARANSAGDAGSSAAADKEFNQAITVVVGSLAGKKDNLALLGLLARLYEMAGKTAEVRNTYAEISRLDPGNPLSAIARADRALKANDLPAAEEGYREALRLKPQNRVVRTRLIDVLVRRKKPDQALTIVDEALRKSPDDIGFSVTKSRIFQSQEKYTEAVRELKRAVKLSRQTGLEKRHYTIHQELARIHLHLGRLIDARHSLEAARDLRPDLVDARLSLARIALKQGRLAESRAECLRVIETKPNVTAYLILGDIARGDKDVTGAERYYRRAVTEFPSDPNARCSLAGLLLGQKKTDEAVVELKKAVELEKYSVRSVALLAEAFLREKRFDEAIAVCKDGLDKTDEASALYRFMGNVERARGKPAQARRYYDISLEKRPGVKGVYLARAQTYLDEKDEAGAIEEARNVLKLDRVYEPAYLFMEHVYAVAGNRDKQQEIYREWIRSVPTSVVASNNYAWFLLGVRNDPDAALTVVQAYRNRMSGLKQRFLHAVQLDDTEGMAYFKKGDYKKALSLFKKSVEKVRDSATYWEHVRMACEALNEQAREHGDEPAANRYKVEAHKALTRVSELSPGVFNMQTRVGNMRLKEGKITEAIRAFENALKIKKAHDVQRTLAEILIRDGRPEQARPHVVDLIKNDPENPDNLLLEAMLLSRLGKSGETVKLLEEVVQKHPGAYKAYYVLAGAYVSQGNLEKARTSLDKTIELAPEFSGARLLKARLLAAQDRYDEAVAECQAVVNTEPMNFEASFNMGNFYLAQRKMNEAERVFKSMTRKWPDSVLARVRLAETFHRSNRLGEALLEYRDARRRNPRSLVILRGMSVVLQSQRKTDRAVREYETYLEGNPQSTNAWLDLAGLHIRQQRWADAERALKAAVKTDRTNPLVHKELADFYTARKRYPEARAVSRRMMRDIPTKAGRAMGHTTAASSYEVEGKLEEAIKEYRLAISEDSTYVVAINNLAWILATRKNRPDEAVELAEPHLKAYQEFAELYDTVGWAYRLKNETKKAEPLLAHSVRLQIARKKIRPSIFYHYGEVLFMNGKGAEAKKFLEVATRTQFPEFEKAKAILSKIK